MAETAAGPGRAVFVVQASSRSWAGGTDLCMNRVDGRPAVHWTVRRILEHVPDARVVVAAPAFDRGGALDALRATFPASAFSIYYGHDASPLDRLLAIGEDLGPDGHLVRVDGLHCFFDVTKALEMWRTAHREALDCVKFPDGYPVQLTADVYRVAALARVRAMLDAERPPRVEFSVHPKFLMFHERAAFRCRELDRLPEYSDAYLRACRERARSLYAVREEHHDGARLAAGDGLMFRYEVAARYLAPTDAVLDIACGWGFGTRYLAERVHTVRGADLDAETIDRARSRPPTPPNASFHVEDATRLSFPAESFDAAVSIETIEHLEADPYLDELYRVLRPGGRLFLSTPQNMVGHIPINAEHLREYGLEELQSVCARRFAIEKTMGQKSGRICFDDDPTGSTTLLLCRKR